MSQPLLSPWHVVKDSFSNLRRARDGDGDVAACWDAFHTDVQRCNLSPPYHLSAIVEALDDSGLPRDEITVFDHGCGSGITLLYLLALGYTNIWGVDIGGGCAAWNTHLIKLGLISQPRFFGYDGNILPLPDRSVDVLISQQVAEHVSPNLLNTYYSEAGRVLKESGLALHQVPHRLGPYESHTRTWFIHYLPRSLALMIYGLVGDQRDYFDRNIFLRWPWVHARLVRQHIGPFVDLTPDRVSKSIASDYYDGPSGLRNFIARIARAPLFGRCFAQLVGLVLMCETCARRRSPSDD